jgi:hypothetical protein
MQEGAVVDALGDAVAGSQAMEDLVEEPLDGGASTLWWSRAPTRGPAAASSLSPIRSQGSRCSAKEGVERTSVLGFNGENRVSVLFRRDQRATVRWEWTDGD